MKKYFGALFVVASLVACKSETEKRAIDFVNPFIGTAEHGHTFPGATTPFGMVQLSPDTGLEGWDWCSGYHYSDSSIIGFSHTHLSGTGRSDLMDVMIMPTVGEVKWNAGTKVNPDEGYRSRFSHDEEWASPGYYKVKLKDYGIMAELTASPRCGFHRYTFPKADDAHIMLDLSHHFATDSIVSTVLNVVDNHTITGERHTKGWGEPGEKYWSKQRIYFVMQTSKPFKNIKLALNGQLTNQRSITGKDVKSVLDFDTEKNETIEVKVGISAVSVENAIQNLEREIPDWNFDGVLAQARSLYDKELSKIRIDATDSIKTIFYTALYHSFVAPYLYNDVNGEYRGFDDRIHRAEGFSNYTVFSLWDTFRAENPLVTLLAPDVVNDFVNSMLAQYEQSGLLPVWPLWSSETNCMIGYHAVPVIVDAYFKGIRGFDVEIAYHAMKTSAMQDDFGVKELKEYGYIPYDKYNKSVSTALEYCYDDWCIAQMAKDLGKDEDYTYFMNRAMSYSVYFDKEYKLMNGFSSDKKFRRPFNPFYSSYQECDWVEGNSWQYSFFVPHDVQGLIGLHGSPDAFVAALDTLFAMPSVISGHDVPLDISGLIGQYAHGNEPSHQVAYLYNYAGVPHKSQEKLHEIMSTLYTAAPDGLCGNEDCGQMSAWYVFSAMGFYPVNPAEQIYVLGKPMLQSAEFTVKDKPFKMIAHNLNKENIYVQSVLLNWKEYDKLYISHEDIVNGGTLEFVMGNVPSHDKDWVLPPSVTVVPSK